MRKISKERVEEEFFEVAYDAAEILDETLNRSDVLSQDEEKLLSGLSNYYLRTIDSDEDNKIEELYSEAYGDILSILDSVEDQFSTHEDTEDEEEIDLLYRALGNIRYVVEYRIAELGDQV